MGEYKLPKTTLNYETAGAQRYMETPIEIKR
jgi:hypothetical protein